MMLEELEGQTDADEASRGNFRGRLSPSLPGEDPMMIVSKAAKGTGERERHLSSLSDNVCKQSMHITSLEMVFYQRAALLAPLIKGRHRHSRR